jgi:hypothetical protein
MKKSLLFLLLVVFAISCNENSSPLIEEETNYNPFAIAPEKAKAEAGTKVYTSYWCSGSTASPSDVPQAFSQMGYTSSSTAAFNLSTIMNNIDNNRPVFIWGYRTGGAGHSWVVEGYKIADGIELSGRDCPDGMEDTPPTPTGGTAPTAYYLYFNLGNSALSNGFYYAALMHTWAYPQDIGIIHNIHPN